jgi:hypothetical protein
MNRQELKSLLVAASRRTAGINFSDAQSAARNAIVQHFGLENLSARELQRRKYEVFDVVSEAIDEVVPMMLQDRTGDFAEIKVIGRNEQALFRVKSNLGSQRRMKSIQQGARGGIYKAKRLDGRDIAVYTKVWSVGWNITLEELLTGQRTIAEMAEVLAQAWLELIYGEVFKALQAAAAAAPQVNRVIGTTAINNANLDKLISIVKAYGTPRILGFSQHLGLLGNALQSVTVAPQRPEADLIDVRNQGYIQVYKGVPVIELPNYIATHPKTGAMTFMFDEDKIFIMPAEERPLKVVFQGDSYIQDIAQAAGGEEYHQHRMMGVTMIFNEYIASYTLTDGWDSWVGGPWS